MDLTFTVAARIAKPVAEVFEAIVNPAQLSRYFTRRGPTQPWLTAPSRAGCWLVREDRARVDPASH